MHSSYSTFNSRCEQELYVKTPSIRVDNADVARTILPQIDEDAVLEGTESFIEDMEILLQDFPIQEPIDEEIEIAPRKPRARRDLSVLMTEKDKKDLLQQPTPRLGLRRRLETYLEEELEQAEKKKLAKEESTQDNHESHETLPDKAKPPRKCHWGKNKKKKQPKDADGDKPVVWIIRPGFNKDGTLRFKFSTDAGAFFMLKDEEALGSLEIMKKKSTEKTFFQVYHIEGGMSKTVGADQVTDLMNQVLVEAKRSANEGGETPEDNPTVDMSAGAKSRPGYRLIRYILRRRWKKLVRRQVGIAMSDGEKSAQSWMVIFPLVLFWKLLTRRSRSFH